MKKLAYTIIMAVSLLFSGCFQTADNVSATGPENSTSKVSGRIALGDRAVEDVRVVLEPPQNPRLAIEVPLNRDGSFEVEVPRGDYRLRVDADGNVSSCDLNVVEERHEIAEEIAVPERTPEPRDPVVEEPTRDPVVEEPTRDPVVEEPTRDPVVKEPTRDPVVEEPTRDPVVEVPARDPVVEEPTRDPVVDEPTRDPVVEEPARDPVDDGGTRTPDPVDDGSTRTSEPVDDGRIRIVEPVEDGTSSDRSSR